MLHRVHQLFTVLLLVTQAALLAAAHPAGERKPTISLIEPHLTTHLVAASATPLCGAAKVTKRCSKEGVPCANANVHDVCSIANKPGHYVATVDFKADSCDSRSSKKVQCLSPFKRGDQNDHFDVSDDFCDHSAVVSFKAVDHPTDPNKLCYHGELEYQWDDKRAYSYKFSCDENQGDFPIHCFDKRDSNDSNDDHDNDYDHDYDHDKDHQNDHDHDHNRHNGRGNDNDNDNDNNNNGDDDHLPVSAIQAKNAVGQTATLTSAGLQTTFVAASATPLCPNDDFTNQCKNQGYPCASVNIHDIYLVGNQANTYVATIDFNADGCQSKDYLAEAKFLSPVNKAFYSLNMKVDAVTDPCHFSAIVQFQAFQNPNDNSQMCYSGQIQYDWYSDGAKYSPQNYKGSYDYSFQCNNHQADFPVFCWPKMASIEPVDANQGAQDTTTTLSSSATSTTSTACIASLAACDDSNACCDGLTCSEQFVGHSICVIPTTSTTKTIPCAPLWSVCDTATTCCENSNIYCKSLNEGYSVCAQVTPSVTPTTKATPTTTASVCGAQYATCGDSNPCCAPYSCQTQDAWNTHCVYVPQNGCQPQYAGCGNGQGDCCSGFVCNQYNQCTWENPNTQTGNVAAEPTIEVPPQVTTNYATTTSTSVASDCLLATSTVTQDVTQNGQVNENVTYIVFIPPQSCTHMITSAITTGASDVTIITTSTNMSSVTNTNGEVDIFVNFVVVTPILPSSTTTPPQHHLQTLL